MITHTYELDMVPGGVQVVVHLSQYDDDFSLVFNLFARTGTLSVPNGTSVRIRGTKLDGTGYFRTLSGSYGSISLSDPTRPVVTVNGDKQMTAVAGAQIFELSLIYNNKELSTANFVIWVERAALDKDTVPSTSELRELISYIDQASEIIAAGQQYASYQNALEATATRAETAASSAQEASATASSKVSQINTKYQEAISGINTEYQNAMSVIRGSAAQVNAATTTGLNNIDTEYRAAVAMIKGIAVETKRFLDLYSENLNNEFEDSVAAIKAALSAAMAKVETAYENFDAEAAQDISLLRTVQQQSMDNIDEVYRRNYTNLQDLGESVMNRVNTKGEQIVRITTSAEEIASQALTTANNAENHMAGLDNQMRKLESDMENISIDPDDLGLEQDPDTYYVYPTYKGIKSENGIPLVGGTGGGGGGGSAETIKAVITVENTSGWLSKTIATGAEVAASFFWTSVEDGMPTGDGTVRITVNNVVRSTRQISQGSINVDLTPFLSTGTNKVKVRIADIYDQGRTISFNVTSLDLAISSSFDTTNVYDGPFVFPYTPKGAIEKTVHFIIDGVEAFTQVTSVSNRQMSQSIPAQPHGGHSLLVYFDADINGELVRSNELYFEFVATEKLHDQVIITSSFNQTEVDQYSSVAIPFTVFDPASATSEVRIYANDILISTQTVDNHQQSYTYMANSAGTTVIRIESGGVTKRLQFTVRAAEMNVQAETENLVMHLTAQGRSNNEATRAQWISGNISASLSGFTWRLDGWQTDEDNINVLRISDDARVTIPYKIFETDFKPTGKTIEIEFATREVANYSAEIISCFANNIGLKITPQQIVFRGAQTEISALYKDNEHIRLAIVVEKQNDNRLIMVYINGVMSGAVQYASGERFSQLNPVAISIGSDDCTVDIYNIRIYDNNLTRQQVVTNWIADTQIGNLKLERYNHNNVYDAYGNITVANLPGDLPYMIIEANELPQYKGDKKTDISGSYTDPLHPGKSFTFTGVEMDVQGTSSAVYYRKNYDMKFEQGFTTASGTSSTYGLRTNSIPFNRFVLKADVASSESANNTELTMFYNDTCPYKIPEMIANPRVRWGIEGVPIVLFWHDKAMQETHFMGKYNFNLPKRMPEPLGYSENMESWEVERNNSANVKFQDNDFTSTSWDTVNQKEYPTWYDDFEARFPSDEWRDIAKLNEFLSWVKSTWRTQATNSNLSSSVTYRVNTRATVDLYPNDSSYTVVAEQSNGQNTGYYNITFTKDTPAYRLTKFRAEFGDYAELDSATFYYLFTELFLMIDSRAKNMFLGFHGGDISDGGRAMDRKVVFEPYDMDTAIGTNNSGVLMFGYYLEDIDHVSSIISGGDSGGTDAPVYNAQDSALWENFRDAFRDRCVSMYRQLRSSGAWSYDAIESRFEDHQSKWPESIFNEDSYLKYIEPLVDPVTVDEATGQLVRTDRYLTMLQGSKEEQRKWWLWNRFRYLDSKYHVGGAIANTAFIRFFNSGTLYLTSAIDMYMGVSFGGGTTPDIKRATANTPVAYPYQMDSTVTEMETWIYSADLITNIGDISVFYPNEVTLTNATRLKELHIGSNRTGYSNANLNKLNVQNSVLLEYIDVRNCPNLASTINLENSPRLKQAYFEGTAITGVDLADGGSIETLHLPGTITALVLMNLNKLSDLSCPSYANVTRLMLTNIPQTTVDPLTILRVIPAQSQINLQGFDYTMNSAAEIREFLALLNTMKGVSREKGSNGEWLYHEFNTPANTVVGTIHISTLTGPEYAEFTDPENGFPYIVFDVETLSSTLTYKTFDGVSTLKTVTCLNGVPQESGPSGPSRSSTAQYIYTFVGWSKTQDAQTADSDAATNVRADRTVYAAYSRTTRTYTVTWKNSDNTVLETDTDVPYGATPQYNGATPQNPTSGGGDFVGWVPAISTITSDITYTASYIPVYTVRFMNESTVLQTVTVNQGQTANYSGATPTKTGVNNPEDYEFTGWSPSNTNVTSNRDCVAQFNFIGVPETISDSWEQIFANIQNGTYKTKYNIGDTKKLDVGSEGTVSMQIVAFDSDELADSSGMAPITWMSLQLLKTNRQMKTSSSNTGGWENSGVRMYLKNTVKPLISSAVANEIKEVKKYSHRYDTSENNALTTDDVWIPSKRELSTINTMETLGPSYASLFPDNQSLVKCKVGLTSGSYWWTRSTGSGSTGFFAVSDNGYINDTNASGRFFIALCFCT